MTKKTSPQQSVDKVIKNIETHISELNKCVRKMPKGFYLQFEVSNKQEVTARLTKIIEANDAKEE